MGGCYTTRLSPRAPALLGFTAVITCAVRRQAVSRRSTRASGRASSSKTARTTSTSAFRIVQASVNTCQVPVVRMQTDTSSSKFSIVRWEVQTVFIIYACITWMRSGWSIALQPKLCKSVGAKLWKSIIVSQAHHASICINMHHALVSKIYAVACVRSICMYIPSNKGLWCPSNNGCIPKQLIRRVIQWAHEKL